MFDFTIKQIIGLAIRKPRSLLTAQPQASRCPDCGYLTSQREHLGCLRKAVAELDAATGGQPQASAAATLGNPVSVPDERAAFEREDRYIVIKRSDMDRIPNQKVVHSFLGALGELSAHSVRIPQRKFLVIESDWPEYDPAWKLIQDRVQGRPILDAAPAQPAVQAEENYSTTSDRYRADLYDEVWQLARDMGYGNVTMALEDLAAFRANAPAQSEVQRLREALEWYAEKSKQCRKIGADGDNARQALDLDGGFRALDALAASTGQEVEK